MSEQLVSAIAGAAISLGLSYIPGLKGLWEPLEGVQKRFVMAVLMLVTAAGAYGGACQGFWGGECGNWQLYAEAFFAALVANQAAYQITKG